MDAVDRLRRAVGATNAITEAREPRAAPTPAPAALTAPGAARPPATAGEPEAVARAYHVEQRGRERRYYDDHTRKGLAMRATGTTITTRREDLDTVRAMLDLAEGRGWRAVAVSGTTAFRREAWIEASARGLDARRYKATDLDRQEADRRRAGRGVARDNQVRPAAAGAPREGAVPPQLDPGELPFPRGREETRRDYAGAKGDLSYDGRTVLRALNSQIDRRMALLNGSMKAELKVFVAEQLRDKERAEGPIVLSAQQRELWAGFAEKRGCPDAGSPARARPEPAQGEVPRPDPAPARMGPPGEPRLARGR